MASTPATTKPKARKPARAVTPRGPDLDALEQFVTEVAETRQTAVTRDATVRLRFVTDLRVLETEKAALGEKRTMAARLFEALTTVLDAEEADIDAAIGRYRNALLDGAEQERTAA